MDAVSEIKRRISIADYVGRYVALSRSGRNLKGLCPFHQERTPSFYVFPDRGSWRCFGACGEGGDVFSFVQRREGIDFSAALRLLAREAGIELSRERAVQRTRREQLSRLVAAAASFYSAQLDSPAGREALDYLVGKRGLTAETIREWGLGWAPDGWRVLRDHLAGLGFEEATMVAAGLLVEPEGAAREPYDRFRRRITIPLRDERGSFVGLAGRALGNEEPKYLNSPQTELFDKGRTLFGLDRAAGAIRESGTAVVVEGYMDVIGPWQAGFHNLVATMGTSLTEGHVLALRRLARRVVLALDPDAAGLAAAERAGELFLSVASPAAAARAARSVERVAETANLELRVATLPGGKDPDEVARTEPDLWAKAVGDAPSFADFAISRLLGGERPESSVERRRLIDKVQPVLLAIRDPVEQALYVQRVARRLGVTERAVHERIRRARRGGRAASPPEERVPPSREELLLAVLLHHPELRERVRSLPQDLFSEAVNREVFRRWLHEEEPADSEDPVVARWKRIEAVRLPPLSEEQARRAASRSVEAILRDRLLQRQAAVAEEIAEAERRLGASQVASLSHEAWLGAMPADEVAAVAQAVIEELELGISIHRREAGDLV